MYKKFEDIRKGGKKNMNEKNQKRATKKNKQAMISLQGMAEGTDRYGCIQS